MMFSNNQGVCAKGHLPGVYAIGHLSGRGICGGMVIRMLVSKS